MPDITPQKCTPRGMVMTVKPILFSGPMVRAILAGRKSQTRRVLCAADPSDDAPEGYRDFPPPYVAFGFPVYEDVESGAVFRFSRSHAIGDLLWVREAWAPLDACTHNDPGSQALADRGFYRADYLVDCGDVSRWHPSIFMPRWASRLTLRVTDVRVQRVQEISEADAVAEGIERLKSRRGFYDPTKSKGVVHLGEYFDWATDAFGVLWDSLNAKRGYGWDENPWVAAYTFEVIHQNVDEVAT